MDSNHRPSGYEPDELPLLHAAAFRSLKAKGPNFNPGLAFCLLACSFTVCCGARTYSPSGHPASTIGAAAFHDPVRDGTGWVHGASRTPLAQGPVQRKCLSSSASHIVSSASLPSGKPSSMRSPRLHASRRLQLGPLAQSSPGGLTRPKAVSVLILRCISHLDAFSGSCFRT